MLADILGELRGGIEIVLEERILDADERVVLGQLHVVVRELPCGELHPVDGVDSVLEELGGCRVDGEEHILAGGVSGIGDRVRDGGERLVDGVHGGSESALVADVDGSDPVPGLQDALEAHVDLGGHAEAVGEGLSPSRDDHAFLDLQVPSGVLAAVDDVEHRNRKGDVVLPYVLVDLHTLGHGACADGCEGYRHHGIPSEPGLVLGAVELDHGAVDGFLIGGIHPDEGLGDGTADVLNGLQDALPAVPGLVPVPELQGLPGARGGTGGRDGRYPVSFDRDLRLDRGVAPGIEDLPRPYLLYLHFQSSMYSTML